MGDEWECLHVHLGHRSMCEIGSAMWLSSNNGACLEGVGVGWLVGSSIGI